MPFARRCSRSNPGKYYFPGFIFFTLGIIHKKGGSEMAVKIIIRRKVHKGKETQLLPLLFELRAKAVTQIPRRI